MTEQDVLDSLAQLPSRKKTTTPLEVCVANMVDAGGIVEYALVDDERVEMDDLLARIEEGTVDKDDAVLMLEITQTGIEVLDQVSVKHRLEVLLSQAPDYRTLYLQVLQACESPQTLGDITQIMQADGLVTSPHPGADVVYPSTIVDALQQTGALMWSGGWVLTQEGRDAFAQVKK